MKSKYLCGLLCLLCATSPGFAQDSSVPESVRRMIEQSQAATHYEQMARMQIEVQYRDFLDALTGSAQHKAEVEAALVGVLSERAELSALTASGRGSTADLEAISDYAYLREQVAPLLSSAELAVLDSRQGGPTDAQIKRQYAAELSRVAVTLTPANQDMVLDTLLKYLQVGQDNSGRAGQLSVDDLVARQMQSFMQAEEELVPQFTGTQQQEVIDFMNQLQSNLYRNRSMSEVGQ